MINLTKLPDELSENELAAVVIEICFQIHRKWGPGLLESVYEALLVHHLRVLGFYVDQQKDIPFDEDGVRLNIGFRADVIVQRKLIVELKSIKKVPKSYPKTVLTYLRILKLKLGLIVNFGETYLKNGVQRIINGQLS